MKISYKMKKITLTLCTMLMAIASAWADDNVTGLKIDMKDETKGYAQILFTDSPVINHDLDHSQLVISATGIEDVVLNIDEVNSLTFVHIEQTETGIEQLFPQAEQTSAKGIYTLSGQKVDTVKKGQVYIINGNKVLIK